MAYNPFDDVIDQDPAYMQTGNGTPLPKPKIGIEFLGGKQKPTQSVIPQRRADYTQETSSPFVDAVTKGLQLITPKDQTLEEIEKNKQLRSLSTAQALKGTQFEEYAGQPDLPSFVVQSPGIRERLDAAGYERQSAFEGASRIMDFMAGDEKRAFEKLSSGQKLDQSDITAVAMTPLLALDAIGLGAIATRLGRLGFKKIDDVLKSTSQDPDVIKLKETLGGGDTMQRVESTIMRSPADEGGGSGYKPGSNFEKINLQAREARQKRIDDLNVTLSETPLDKPLSFRQMLRKLKIGTDDSKVLEDYINKNPDSLVAKSTLPKQTPRKDQLTDEALALLQEEANLLGQPVNLRQAEELTGIPRTNLRRLLNKDKVEGLDKLIAPREIQGDAGTFFKSYIPPANRSSSLESQVQALVLRDMYRSGEFGTDQEFMRIMKDAGITPRILESKANGKVKWSKNPDYNVDEVTPQRKKLFEFVKKEYLEQADKDLGLPIGTTYDNLLKKMDERNKLTNYTEQKFVEAIQNNEGFRNQFQKELERIYPKKEITDIIKEAKDYANLHFMGQMGHIMPVAKTKAKTKVKGEQFKLAPGIEGKMFYPDFMSVNFAAHNIGYQNRAENILKNTIAEIKKGNDIDKNITKLQDLNNLMNERGIRTYLRFTEKQIPEKAFNRLQKVFGNKIEKEPNVKGVYGVFLGKETDPTLAENISYFDKKLNEYIQNPKSFKISAQAPKEGLSDEMFISGSAPYIQKGQPLNFEKGGAVKMAKGGLDSVLENMNQQNFIPDPAIDGDSAFQQAVKSGNLTAFNIPKVFKTLGDTFGVFTPKRASAPTATTAEGIDAGTALGAPPGQTLPATKPLQSEDFVFESFTLDKINSPTAPKAAKPQDWINYLQGGKDKAPSAELLDSGLFQYMADFEKFFPGQKMTKQQIVELYEQSPIANLKIKVKTDRTDASPYDIQTQETMGRSQHKNAGNARIDAGGTDYREIVLEAGPLPGEQKPYVNSTHFSEDNVLVFSRVANYDNKAGEQVAVIQELQTDLLTKVRKEQERLNAIIENKKLQLQRNNNIIQDPNRDQYDRSIAQENLNRLTPELNQLEKVKETNLISPYPMTVAKDLIPTYQKRLNDLQSEINSLLQAGVNRTDPEFLMKINQLEEQQKLVLDDLLNLNRTSNFDDLTKGIKVPGSSDTDTLQNIAEGRDNYYSSKDLETFPPIPFNKQADYVDLILKATIKDAEARGINKVAIMPADVGANPRWGKTTLQMDREDKSSGDKFRNLYDKVGVQQLKNIAKKYGGQLNIEEIIDPQKSNLGLTFSTRNIEGTGFNFMKELDVDQNAISRGDLGPANRFLNEEILRVAEEMAPNEVVYRKETAPGQTMDYFVNVIQTDTGNNFDLVPLKAGDDALDAKILIEDRDPSAIKMYTITLPEKTKDKPFFLFRKKEGGKIPGDRLVSITDIYGDY